MKSISIPKETRSRDDQDFYFLKEKGLEYITGMSAKIWTDHNLHDPGITFLETLCYAITDLGYRINLPIQDLLDLKKQEDTFPGAKRILTTSALTPNDYRKLFIDLEGVKNAFIRPVNRKFHRHCSLLDEETKENPKSKLSYEKDLLPNYQWKEEYSFKGLNKILFEPDNEIRQLDDTAAERIEKIGKIIEEIKLRYHDNRNVCEDLVEVREVEYYEFQVCGDIEIEKTASAQEVIVEILFRIQEYASPSIRRYSLQELLAENMTAEEIFNGPVLENGFIKDNELKNAEFKSEIRLSDVIKIISEVPGVKKIKKLNMNSCPCNKEGLGEDPIAECDPLENGWKICFSKGFDKVIDLCLTNSIFNIFKDVIPIPVNQEKISEAFKQKYGYFNRSLKRSYDDFELPENNFRNNAPYFSFQNELPNIYSVGRNGVSETESDERKARAYQLKAYLGIFDQVLSSYFSHLKEIGNLLSSEVSGSHTYFSGELTDIKDFDKIKVNKADFDKKSSQFLQLIDDPIQRKGKLLDHLLARFSENMNDYIFLMVDLFGFENQNIGLWQKASFLKSYANTSYNRGKAFNYYEESYGAWNTYNVSGLQQRIAKLLGITDVSRRNLNEYLFLIEKSSNKWKWQIKNSSAEILFSGVDLLDTREQAEDSLWSAIVQAWDPQNYRTIPSGSKWTLALLDTSFEVIAEHPGVYNEQDLAQEEIPAISAYIFEKVTDEGFFMFENILLRPDYDDGDADSKFMEICVDEDCNQCKPGDPYSLRLHFVFPGWTRRFSNPSFREFAEKIIRQEVPAHILSKVCWIGKDPKTPKEDGEGVVEDQMKALQELYKKWLEKKMASPEDQKDNEFLKPLVDLLHGLNNVHRHGKLHDCNEDGKSNSSIILNRSYLGNLKNDENGSE